MPAQHQKEYCHVDKTTGEILEGPMALPQNWGSVAGFKNLPARALAKYSWYQVRDDSVVQEGDEYVLLWLPEQECVVKAPMGNDAYRGGQRYLILQLYQMFEYFSTVPFYSSVLGDIYKFPNKPCENTHRQNCLITKQDYSCIVETLKREFVRVTVPHEDIEALIKDAVNSHNQQLEKAGAGLKDIISSTDAEQTALLDTNLSDYYG